jgi:hypothetical protein
MDSLIGSGGVKKTAKQFVDREIEYYINKLRSKELRSKDGS